MTAVLDDSPAAATAEQLPLAALPGWPPLRGPAMMLPPARPEPGLAPPARPEPRPAPPARAAAAPQLPRRALVSLSLPRLALRWPSGDTVITWAMAITVAVVAVDAAIVSYSHIYALATGHWGSGDETGIQARLLPLSIDGVIAEASLVKLWAARHALRGKTRLATFMLWLGIVATVAANVTHGLPSTLLPPVAHIVIMATLSAWPAGAFIGSVEMLMGLVRSKRDVARTTTASGDQDGDGGGDQDGDGGDSGDQEGNGDSGNAGAAGGDQGSDGDTSGRGSSASGGRGKKPGPSGKRDRLDAAIRKTPGWRTETIDTVKIGAAVGVHKRTVERRLKDLRAGEPGAGEG